MACTTECRKPNGNQAHCGATSCHQTFSTVANFDKHRVGVAEHRHCVDPSTVGLRLGADMIWRGEPGTWRPRAHVACDPQTAESTSGVGPPRVHAPEAAETRPGGSA